MWPFFNPIIEEVTFHLYEWCGKWQDYTYNVQDPYIYSIVDVFLWWLSSQATPSSSVAWSSCQCNIIIILIINLSNCSHWCVQVPVLEPESSLWKCYMMTGKWSEADNLLLENEELRPFLPQQVARICQAVDRVEVDRVAVLTQMLDLPFIRQKLRVLVAETLISELGRMKWCGCVSACECVCMCACVCACVRACVCVYMRAWIC